MNDLWLKDVMSQKFINSDLTRIIMLKAFVKNGIIAGAYKKIEVLEYIYRVYADNEEIRRIHPDGRIRNILLYGISDIKYILDTALNEWKDSSQFNILAWDERYIYIADVGESGESLGNYTIQLTEMLLKKYFSVEIKEPLDIEPKDCINDSDVETFGLSLYRNRVLEDMQYCPICEETDTNKLRVVHILPAQYCDNEDELIDKSNGIILCKEHAQEYIDGKFWFKENGFVEIDGSETVEPSMHLSINIKTRSRRRYIEKVARIRAEQTCGIKN